MEDKKKKPKRPMQADDGGDDSNPKPKMKKRKPGGEEVADSQETDMKVRPKKKRAVEPAEGGSSKKGQVQFDQEAEYEKPRKAAKLAERQTKMPTNTLAIDDVKEEQVMKSKPQPEDTMSVYEEAVGLEPKYFGSNPKQEYRPPTLTGITELPVKDFFLMLLLWAPRFFVPWISAWHEFNVFVMAPPDDLDAKQADFLTVDLIVFGVASVTSVLVSIIADMASMRYYVYLILLSLFTLCPIAGGYVDVVLRSRMLDKKLYNHWFSAMVMMRAAMAIPLVFFPVQFTCIFTEKDNMSRQAHYNWIAFFAFLEFLNAYLAFWIIPAKCPTGVWTQISVWILILALLYLLIVVTLTFSLIVKSLRYTLMTCLKLCGLPDEYFSEEYNKSLIRDKIPRNLRLQKLKWFGLILIPLVFSSFVFATLERFVPDEDWDKHYFVSATSIFYLARMLGVAVMVGVLFWIRKGFKWVLKIPIFRGDVLILGLPLALNILALLIFVGRFATLSSLSPGDVTIGPIPDESKIVVIFCNLMFSNKTVCVGSDYFRPVKVRAFHCEAIEIYDLPKTRRITISIIPEPTSKPLIAKFYVMHFSGQKNRLIVQSINLFNYLNEDSIKNESVYRENMNTPDTFGHAYGLIYDSSAWLFDRPSLKEPRVIIINNFMRTPTGVRYYMLKHGTPPRNHLHADRRLPMKYKYNMYEWVPNKLGTWFIWGSWDDWLPFGGNNTSPPVEFTVDNHTLYLIAFYVTGHIADTFIRHELFRNEEYKVVRTKVFTIGQLAGPGSKHFPDKKELQRDWAIQFGMILAGMAAGGIFVGIVYLFWMDPPLPSWQTTALAVFWVLMMGAAESPKVKLVDVGLKVSCALLGIQVLVTCLHVFASLKLYTPALNFRKRPD